MVNNDNEENKYKWRNDNNENEDMAKEKYYEERIMVK